MNWLAVAFGGALGAIGRYAIAVNLVGVSGRFPLATFIANTLGCFLMGIGFVLIVERAMLPEVWRYFLLIGMLGAFTTFSTFSIETLTLIQDQHWKIAGMYVFSSLLASLVAAGVGIACARTLF